MPFELRTVQRYGVQIDNIGYYDPVLDPYIHAEDPDITSAKRKFLFRRDPRDISKVYFLDPKSQDYAEIPYRNIGHPAISVWELREVQRHFREQGISDVDEERIFQALLRMRRRVDDATAKTKAARRMATRRPAEKPAKPPVAPSKPNRKTGSPLEAPSAQADQDPFSTPILPFDEVSLQR
jgi:putative transposase